MDISITAGNTVEINVLKPTPSIIVERSQQVGIDVTVQPLELKPQKTPSPAFEFVQRVIAGANVIRLTYDEFQALTEFDGKTWYAVTTTADELRYLYLGNTLIAEAKQDGGTWGFAYTFPIIFGR